MDPQQKEKEQKHEEDKQEKEVKHDEDIAVLKAALIPLCTMSKFLSVPQVSDPTVDEHLVNTIGQPYEVDIQETCWRENAVECVLDVIKQQLSACGPVDLLDAAFVVLNNCTARDYNNAKCGTHDGGVHAIVQVLRNSINGPLSTLREASCCLARIASHANNREQCRDAGAVVAAADIMLHHPGQMCLVQLARRVLICTDQEGTGRGP